MLPEQDQHILSFTTETNKDDVSTNVDQLQAQKTTFDVEDEFNALFALDVEATSPQPLDLPRQSDSGTPTIRQPNADQINEQAARDAQASFDFDNLFNEQNVDSNSSDSELDFDALFSITEEVQESFVEDASKNLTAQSEINLELSTEAIYDQVDSVSQALDSIEVAQDDEQQSDTTRDRIIESEASVSLSSELSPAPAPMTALETVIDFPVVEEATSIVDTVATEQFADFDALLEDSAVVEADEDDLDALLETESEAVAASSDEQIDDLDALLETVPANDEFTALDSLLETESEAVAASSDEQIDDLDALLADSADEFDDLDALLETEPTPATDEFDDLDALLETESEAVAASSDEQFDDLDALLADSADEFDDLDALLETAPATDEFAALDSLLDEDIKRVASAQQDNADLDALLENKPQTTAEVPKKTAPKPTANALRKTTFEQTMRVPVKHLDDVGNLVGELVVNRNSLEQDQERLRQFTENLLHRVQQLNELGVRMQELYERSLLETSLISSRHSSRTVVVENNDSERHATGMDFDALEMDRFTGFHTLSQEMIEMIVRVRESASDIEFVTDETEVVARQFRQVTTQLQEGITRSRMIPFSQIADRLPRAVKEITLKYGKQAELEIEGRDTLIDKVILEQLYDPMTHLVNNSITHGIETAEERIAKGKPAAGKITIRAFHQGNQTVISVSDDGAGIDPDRVLTKAIQKGLITVAEARTMSRMDVYNLLFHPGFSTKEQVDEFAGRGVGMDVVRTSLNEIRGTINTDSVLGKGTTFTIRLPLTLSICKALSCLSDKARIAFPMDGVEDMMDIPASSLVTEEGQVCVAWRDSILPLRPLKELINYNRVLGRGNVYGNNREDDLISVVILRSAGTYQALQVDQVLGEQEIVIKQFEAPAPKPLGIAGATIMGDGRVMPIVDVLELIDLALGRIQQNELSWTTSATLIQPETQQNTKSEPTVLIVDDSITVRELLSMTFNKAGYRVEQARDGQEAWDKLRDGLPCDLIFCDIEMPRMDGLELLSRLQKDLSLSEIPIAMLTSRGAERHRQMAVQLGASGYFTKPYLEEVLLEGAAKMLNGEMLVASS